jgi:hypothetical protein
MPIADITRVLPQREPSDCAVTAMAMFTGLSYEDVLRVVAVIDINQGRNGLKDNQVRKVMALLGTPVRFTSNFDLEEVYGLLRLTDHIVLVRNGLAIQDGQLWEVEDFLRARGYYPNGVFGVFVPRSDLHLRQARAKFCNEVLSR